MAHEKKRTGLIAAALVVVLTGSTALALEHQEWFGKETVPIGVARLTGIGPRWISNATSYPLLIHGEAFENGSVLVLEGQTHQKIPVKKIDDRHLAARVPAGLVVARGRSSEKVRARVQGPKGRWAEGEVELIVANDVELSRPTSLVVIGEKIFVSSWSTDEVWTFTAGVDAAPEITKVCDGPRGLASWGEQLLVACDRELRIGARAVPLPGAGWEIAVDAKQGRAYVTLRDRDRVAIVDLSEGTVIGEAAASVNPTAVALVEGGAALIASNAGTEDLSRVDLRGDVGAFERIAPSKGVPIWGGRTSRFGDAVIGGKWSRALAWSEKRGVLFAATIGPNIGPNAEKMEVTMNGGVSVIDPAGRRWLRHVATGGVPEALALDDARGLVYAADGSTGRVVVLDATRLAEGKEGAVLGAVAIDPPADFPLIRPKEDFDTNGRAGISLHSGPKALGLSAGGERLFVLARFTRSVVEVDVRRAADGVMTVAGVARGPGKVELQKDRRLGEIVYYTDLGKSGMTCDTCHPDGRDGGVLYTKSFPIRIYRSPTLLGIAGTAPYFTPSRLPSIQATCDHVLSRNRFGNPPAGREECADLVEFVEAIPSPPNPFVGAEGELSRDLELPDGKRGDAVAGMALFEGKAGCAEKKCHPPPLYTADQSAETRGAFLEVGTPVQIPLRLEHQDTVSFGQAPPSLLGAWDLFPLLASGAAGLSPTEEGALVPTHPFALRRVLELSRADEAQRHGHTAALTEDEVDDLLAFVISL